MPLNDFTERDEARFWAKVALPNEQGCMLWLGAKDVNGYGKLTKDKVQYYAHRVSYALAGSQLAPGTELRQSCRVRHCVSPLHLSSQKRAQEAHIARVITQLAKTHCGNGHEYADANTYRHFTGYRVCRACKRISRQRTAASR